MIPYKGGVVNTDFCRYRIVRVLFLASILSDPALAHAASSATGKPAAQGVGGQRNGVPAAGGERGNPQSLYADDASFMVTPPGPLLVSHHRDKATGHGPATPDAQGSVNVGEVNAASGRRAPHSARKRQLASSTAKTIVDQAQIETLVPPGGSIVHALATAPGVQIRGYGSGNGASRYQIRINGIQVGWALSGGNPEKNGIAVLFDGIPMNNPLAQWDGWESAEVPIAEIFQGVTAVQGPGNPASRWYDSMGGTVDLHPIEPTRKSGGRVSVGGGSFDTYHAFAQADSGDFGGWSTVVGAGYTHSGGFREGPYTGPSDGTAAFMKLRRAFRGGSASFGGYYSRVNEYRPDYIPVAPIPGVSVNGYGVPGTAYSQDTSGFYYTIPQSLYAKNDFAHMWLLYGRQRFHLGAGWRLGNVFWYRAGYRHHNRQRFYYPDYAGINSEYYTGATRTFGDRVALHWQNAWNDMTVGGYYMHERFHSLYYGYNPALFQSSASLPLFVADYYDYWDGAVAFAQDTLRPLPALRITPGVSLMNYRVQFVNNSLGGVPPGASPIAIYDAARNNDNSYTKLAPSLGMNYRLTRSLHAFFTWAQNYQTAPASAYGNYQAHPTVPPSAPTRVNSEIGGLKLDRGPLRGQLSAFHVALSNAVLSTFLPSLAITENADVSAVYNGANLDLHYGRELGWQDLASATVEHAYYPHYVTAGTTVLGASIPNIPTWLVTLGAGYRWYADHTTFSARLWDSYNGQQYLFSNLTNLPTTTTTQGAYNVVNLRLSARIAVLSDAAHGLKDVRVSLLVSNLLDRHYNAMEYISSGGELGPTSAGAVLAVPAAPRALYANLSARF